MGLLKAIDRSLSASRATDDDGENTLEASIGVEEDGFATAEQRVMYQQLAPCLTAREREVVRLRFEEDLMQEEIGKRVGVSQMQVSRVLRQALAKLTAAARAA
jgi:RNA polymerase sigma-B factor